ncbi:g5774 [Coccomyxa elongata]
MSSTNKQGMAKRGVQSDAHTPTTGKLAELLYTNHLLEDILAYQELKPPKVKPNAKCYSTPLEDFVDDADMDNVVMHITTDMNSYLQKDKDGRLRHMDRLVEVFAITDAKHPAKRRHEKCHKWLGLRQIERGLRAKQELRKCAVLGEYCGVVKTSDDHERDTAAACPDDVTFAYLERDKTESIVDDLDLPDGHWAKGQQLIVDASKAGNCLSLINDARGFRPRKQPNASFIQTHDRATSELHIFLVTKRTIKKGQEILLDYGEDFWQSMDAKVVWAEKMAAKEQKLQSAKQALQANEKELQANKKKVAMLEADFKGAMKLVNSAEDQYEDRLSELKKDNQRLQQEKQAAREGELKQVRADHSAALAHAASLQEQLSKAHAQVAEMSNGKQALQERLTSLRASYERKSCEVHRLERAQAVGLQASRAAAQRKRQDILAAEAELRAKEREQAALVAACQEHERREADMARQVALTRAHLAAAEAAEEAAEAAKDALARDMRAREAGFAAKLAAREAALNRERALRAAGGSAGTGKAVPMESTKDIMARLERMGAGLGAKPPVGRNASGPALLDVLDSGMQLALPQAQRQLPTLADLAEDYNIRHGLAFPKSPSAIASNPSSPARQRRPGDAQEPFRAAPQPHTAAVAPETPTVPELMPQAPPRVAKEEPAPEAAMCDELRKMLVADTTMIEEGELPVSEADSCGCKSRPVACKPHGSHVSASSARRPRGGQRARHDRGRSCSRGGPGTQCTIPTSSPSGTFSRKCSRQAGGDRGRSRNGGGSGAQRMNVTASFSPGSGRSGSAGRRRKRARGSRSPGSCRSRSRCGVSERGRRVNASHERSWRKDCASGRSRCFGCRSCNASRGPVSSGAKSHTLIPPEADRCCSPSNASASSRAISQPQRSCVPKGCRDVLSQVHCNGNGTALNAADGRTCGHGGNAATGGRCATPGAAWNATADVDANNQVAMAGALPAASQNGNVLTLRFPAATRPFPAAPKHTHKGNNKYCE